MKNKKGLLLAEETLKIILGVIAIGFLVYLLVSLYFNAKTSKELEQAKETLPSIMSASLSGKTSIDVYNPKNWWLGIWPHEVTTGIISKETKMQFPQTCSNIRLQTCICLCEKDNSENCDDKGICLDNKGFSIEGNSIKIEPPMTLNIDQSNKKISK